VATQPRLVLSVQLIGTSDDRALCTHWLLIHTHRSCTCHAQITLWRKKLRAVTNKFDNEFHDKATDSIINYETVKYFSNEQYEVARYTE
jgi:ABC-type transport system involved in Fe-S cluster assembly fused permease/ATPase subunit